MRLAAAAIVLCGCGRVGFAPTGDSGALVDATSAVDSVPLGPFGTAQPIPALQAAYDIDDPAISPDGLELYVASKAGGAEDIYVSRRASRADAWPAPVVVPGMDTSSTEKGPELTADGLSLYFMKGNAVMVATRTDTLSPWSIAPTGVAGSTFDTPAVCGGGTVMYLRIGDGTAADLYVATRASTSDAWSAPVVVPELSSPDQDSGPWVTPSCDRIYFDSNQPMTGVPYVAERTGASTTFGPPMALDALHAQAGQIHDMSLTGDERLMVFSHNETGFEEIWETSR